jgi:hypothetical protein
MPQSVALMASPKYLAGSLLAIIQAQLPKDTHSKEY